MNTVPLRILVIEDDEDTRANLCDILELDDHAVEAVGTARAARDRDNWSDLSVVLLDRQLPDGTAEELLPEIVQRAPDVAVIVVTGFADVEGAIHALRRGAADYLLKPIDPGALRNTIQRIGALARTRRELRARAEQHAIVARIGQRALASPDLPRLMDDIVDQVRRALDVEFCRILEFSADRQTATLRAGRGWDTALVGRSTPIDEELRMHGQGIVDGICVRIAGEKDSFGTIGVHSHSHREWTPTDVDFLQSMANVLAAALERAAIEERAVQSQRLAAIGQMMTGLAHESRNALQRSQACLEMLALELEDRPAALELVARLQRAQDHLHHLYEEVRGYAAPLRLQRAPCDLRSVWRETWQNLEVARRSKQVRLVERGLEGPLTCEVDRHFVEQTVRNILENALFACPDDGEIVVTADDGVQGDRPVVRLSFRDNGPGLTPEQRQRIFDPFYTTKTQGTGLGMAIAKRIIDAHGGRIELGDSGQAGAELILHVPRSG